ncbi:MAG: hypothetical protein M1828_004767 [Chrysothrix sp. TS-e1954]|nr:MAG: hypothetical protein M1828_004767 [Chrysothrix sp. TS-e1954]
MNDAERELESFRQEWRNEVTTRSRATRRLSAGDLVNVVSAEAHRPGKKQAQPPNSATPRHNDSLADDDFTPFTYHDLEDPEERRRLGNDIVRASGRADEPQSALEHYEKAVDKETVGSLGDSVSLYRKAFRLNSSVHEEYKNKHFPTNSQPSHSNVTEAHASPASQPSAGSGDDHQQLPFTDLIDVCSRLSIAAAPPATDLSATLPCPIADIPAEILVAILTAVADDDVAVFARLSQVCKRLAYLVCTEDHIWKHVVMSSKFGFTGMRYQYACDVDWCMLSSSDTLADRASSTACQPPDMTPEKYPLYRTQFRHRPRIRFNGCYISTVNYTRPGASHQSQYSWSSPVHIVTYYRYLRFFRDGSAISLLTTSEPANVVHHMIKDNVHSYHSQNFPSAVMGHALKARWRLTGPATNGTDYSFDSGKVPGAYTREPMGAASSTLEEEGGLHVESQGVTPKYLWLMRFAFGSAGRKDGTRNNKLSWRGFWSYNKLTDDFGEFGLKNDRPFYFSRVKSYGIGS